MNEEELLRKKLWTTRDGTRVKVKDMEDRHLLNTHRMLRRSNTSAWFFGLLHAGSEDADKLDSYVEEVVEDNDAWIGVFEKEIDKRGLTELAEVKE